MPRSELEGLFQLLRTLPEPESIHDLRVTMSSFIGVINADLPEVARFAAAVPLAENVAADVIVPPGAPPLPVLLYLHGGGWSIGSPASHGKLTRQLALGAGAIVVSVDYRLAPEYPFPTPLDDCVAAARWVRDHIADHGGDPSRVAIGGDSAGANLSAAVVNELRGQFDFRGVLLIYGAFDLATSRRDYHRWAPEEDPVLPKRAMEMMLHAYVSGGGRLDDPRVSPHLADVAHFPPACLLCGTADPLYGESLAFGAKLEGAGRSASLLSYAEMPHAFLQLPCREADEAIAAAAAFLRRVLAA